MTNFAELIAQNTYTLEYAALMMAKEIAYPQLHIVSFLTRLDDLSRIVELRLRPTDTLADQLNRISQYLFEEEGFHGNLDNYYDPCNSFLNDVLVRYTGIPITLSVLYIAVGSRVGLPLYGVGLPGHFIVGCRGRHEIVYLDPFHDGAILTAAECKQISLKYLPAGMPFTNAFLEPQPNRLVLKRMLHNLRHIYLTNDDTEKLLRVLRLEQVLTPTDAELSRDIGILCAHLEYWGEAVRMLRDYLYQRPHASDADTIRSLLHGAQDKLSKLN